MSPLTLFPNDGVAVAIGAVFGSLARYQIGRLAAEKLAQDTPRWQALQGYHTAAINVAGSFMLGGLVGTPTATAPVKLPSTSLPSWGVSPRTKLLLGVGFCGSFTTFSMFAVDIANLQVKNVGTYFLVNNVGGVCAAAAGLALARKIFMK